MACGFINTQARRLQRRYYVRCLIDKEKHQAVALDYAGAQLSTEDEDIMIKSVAVHKLDCANLQANVHYASHANHIATSNGMKSKQLFLAHKKLHQTANVAKHEHYGVRHATTRLTVAPLPPPHDGLLQLGQHILDGCTPTMAPPPPTLLIYHNFGLLLAVQI